MKKFKFNSPEEFLDKLEKVETVFSHSFDGEILAIIMEMIYSHGFTLKDFGRLKIRDVVDKDGKIKWPFKENQHDPSEDFIKSIQCYLDYLKKKGYSSNKNAPLFPQLKRDVEKKSSTPYHERELRRDLKKYANTDWEHLRRDGIYYYYHAHKERGDTDLDNINLIAWYFRTPAKKIYNTLKRGGIKLSDVNLAPVIEPQKTEPAPVETKPQVKLRRKRTRQAEGGSPLEQLERKIHEMNNQGQEDHDRDDNDNKDGTDLSRPIFDPYFYGDDYDE